MNAAAVNEPLALLWVSDSENINMTDGVAIASSITSPDLVIRRNTLVPGSTYQFSLKVPFSVSFLFLLIPVAQCMDLVT